MRQVSIAVDTDIPRKRVDWKNLGDNVRAQWLSLNSRPFKGQVQVGYEWRTRKRPPWCYHPKVWMEVAAMALPLIEYGEPHPGVCRFVPYDEPRLTMTLEEA